jgi:hypothetical protein
MPVHPDRIELVLQSSMSGLVAEVFYNLIHVFNHAFHAFHIMTTLDDFEFAAFCTKGFECVGI